ncbi:helicase-related protein [Dictyobacter aurantiacus]|uniref:ATP-dependent helicase HepA n=1 Tax=Dictyobacter aurantiacus TaxID=1936993 RepID=A0A401ZMR3_9CHLR|nr:helicase-related protein [Dictyobacter aurantiacus]GCE08142.1 ATP-dependent helicase HepA [Dictyobacter aurantiacus]
MNFAVGSLVKARGREWIVLPESSEEVLLLRPLGGTEDEVTGIARQLETVEEASFLPPDPDLLGDYRSCRLLRDAVRLGFRSSAGPFRSFAHLAVEPRPYQLVPLLMALRQEPVRLLIADDVGIGKTVESCLIARELLDRGEISRLAVLCPPHLAEQWQAELSEKFHIDAKLVLSSTVSQLERDCRLGQSLFERYPFVIVSIDFIKSDRRRDEFLRTCPEFVIVDEAHTCTEAGEGRGGRHQRHQLVASVAADPQRHLILVTATPHSGNESAFRSLLVLLNKDFAQLPEDLSGREHEQARRQLAAYFVQRRRADIRAYLHADTPFPIRMEQEQSYKLTPEYRHLVERVMRFARETVIDPNDSSKHRQRVRWWSVLALLRSIASSPAAAAATLRSRAATADTETEEEANSIGRHTLLDLMENEATEGVDLVPGSDFEQEQGGETRVRRRLQEMAREAEALKGAKDEKLQQAIKMVGGMLKDGFQPIVFCRFIPTAEYVAQALRERLPKGVQVEAVTGLLPPVERENRIADLSQHAQRVLVCTDCLSEGVNLQEHFNAVIHYDLSWNPTRHEQREGRVDRFGQPSKQVRVVTYYDGSTDSLDRIVLNVLIRKHQLIRTSLGISVPVPANSEQVIESIFEDRILRGRENVLEGDQMALPGMEDPREKELSQQWTDASEREKRSRSMFSQETIKVDEVARELEAMRSAIGSTVDVETFTRDTLQAYGAAVSQNSQGVTLLDLRETPRALRDTLSLHTTSLKARFELPVSDDEVYLNRTHPVIEGLATYVMDAALDPEGEGVARRCGVIRTSRVAKRTTLLLTRMRFHIVTRQAGEERILLAEDCQILAFSGAPHNASWIDDPATINALVEARPEANTLPEQARNLLRQVIDAIPTLQPHLQEAAAQRGNELREAHRRVRSAAQMRGIRYEVKSEFAPDILGIYVYLPKL